MSEDRVIYDKKAGLDWGDNISSTDLTIDDLLFKSNLSDCGIIVDPGGDFYYIRASMPGKEEDMKYLVYIVDKKDLSVWLGFFMTGYGIFAFMNGKELSFDEFKEKIQDRLRS